MAEMAGEVADGLLVLPFHSQRLLESITLPAIERGRHRAEGRPFEMVCGTIVGVGTDEASLETASLGVRGLLGFYGSTPAYSEVLRAEGLGALHDELRMAVRAGDWGSLIALVPDELVAAVATVGTPDDVAKRLCARFGGLADRLSLFIPHQVDDTTLGSLVAAVRRLER